MRPLASCLTFLSLRGLKKTKKRQIELLRRAANRTDQGRSPPGRLWAPSPAPHPAPLGRCASRSQPWPEHTPDLSALLPSSRVTLEAPWSARSGTSAGCKWQWWASEGAVLSQPPGSVRQSPPASPGSAPCPPAETPVWGLTPPWGMACPSPVISSEFPVSVEPFPSLPRCPACPCLSPSPP